MPARPRSSRWRGLCSTSGSSSATPACRPCGLVLPHLEAAHQAAPQAQALEILRTAASPTERLDLDRALMRLYHVDLGDPAAAWTAGLRVIGAAPGDPSVRAALAALAAQLGRDGEWARHLGAALIALQQAGGQGARVRATATELAQLAGERLGDRATAERAWLAVLEVEADAPDAFDALAAAYRADQRWPDLRALLERRASVTPSEPTRLATLLQLAVLEEQLLGDPVRAIAAYRGVLSSIRRTTPRTTRSTGSTSRPSSGPSSRRCSRARRTSRATKASGSSSRTGAPRCSRTLAQPSRAPASPAEAIVRPDASFSRAVDLLEELLARQSGHADGRELLEELLADPKASGVKLRVARLLEPLYERDRLCKDLVGILHVERALATGTEAALLLARIAQLEETELGSNRNAFDAWIEVLAARARRRARARRAAAARAVAAPLARGHRRARGRRRRDARGRHRDPRRAARRARDVLRRPARRRAARDHRVSQVARGRSRVARDHAPRERRARTAVRGGPAVARAARRDPPAGRVGRRRRRAPRATRTRRRARRGAAARPRGRDRDVARRAPRSAGRSSCAARARAPAHRDRAVACADRRVAPDDRRRARASRSATRAPGRSTCSAGSPRSTSTSSASPTRRSPPGSRSSITRRPHARSLGELSRLYRAANRDADLLDVYERQVQAAHGDEALALNVQIAKLLGGSLGRPTEALDRWEHVLQLDPQHAEALAAVEAALADHDLRAIAAEMLRPVYAAAAQDERIAQLSLRQAEWTDDPSTKLRALTEVVMLREHRLGDKAGAFAAQLQALRYAASEPELAHVVADTERLAGELGREADLIDAYRAIAPDVLDAEIQRRLYLDIADLSRAVRQRPRARTRVLPEGPRRPARRPARARRAREHLPRDRTTTRISSRSCSARQRPTSARRSRRRSPRCRRPRTSTSSSAGPTTRSRRGSRCSSSRPSAAT